MATGFKQLNASAKYLFPSFNGRLAYDDFNYASLWLVCIFCMIYLFSIFGIFWKESSSFIQGPHAETGTGFIIFIIITSIVFVFSFISIISLYVRRLHDTGRSGHWLWLYFLGLGIVPLFLSLGDTASDNIYGKGNGNGPKSGFSDLKKAVRYYFQPAHDRLTYKEFALSTMVLSFIFSIITGLTCFIFGSFNLITYTLSFQSNSNHPITSPFSNFSFYHNSLYILAGILGIFTLLFIVLFIRLTIRRLHDTGRSGRVYWWSLIPVVGLCVPLMMIFCDSDNDNEYGPAKTLAK